MQRPSFESVVEQFYQPLFRFALSLTKHETEACDLTQQTFYLWATKGHQLRDATKVKSWLFTTLHREFLSLARRRRRFEHTEMDESSPELPVSDPTMVNDLDGKSALAALQQVEELYRAPLALFYLKDHSYKEIAAILEIPIGTVMSRLARGKGQLRKILADRKKSPTAANKIIPLDSDPQRKNFS
ncbi:MAG: RNA polymerase sigma factor [Verrucomicrobiota bacterium]